MVKIRFRDLIALWNLAVAMATELTLPHSQLVHVEIWWLPWQQNWPYLIPSWQGYYTRLTLPIRCFCSGKTRKTFFVTLVQGHPKVTWFELEQQTDVSREVLELVLHAAKLHAIGLRTLWSREILVSVLHIWLYNGVHGLSFEVIDLKPRFHGDVPGSQPNK